MKLNEYERKALKDIKEWEKSKHTSFHKRILDITSKPVDYIIQKIGPDKFHHIEKLIEKTIKQMVETSRYTVNPKVMIERARKHGVKIKKADDIKKCDLKLLDTCIMENIDFHEKAAAIQGAVLGLGGGAVAFADLTTLLVQDFHMIQEIAFCYSFDPNDRIEKEIILRVIEIAMGGSLVKFKGIKDIEKLKKIKQGKLKPKATKKGVSVLGAKALEEFIEDLTISILVRMLPRTLPIISIAVSAHSNHEIIEHSGKTAKMIYRKRFIERKKELKK